MDQTIEQSHLQTVIAARETAGRRRMVSVGLSKITLACIGGCSGTPAAPAGEMRLAAKRGNDRGSLYVLEKLRTSACVQRKEFQ